MIWKGAEDLTSLSDISMTVPVQYSIPMLHYLQVNGLCDWDRINRSYSPKLELKAWEYFLHIRILDVKEFMHSSTLQIIKLLCRGSLSLQNSITSLQEHMLETIQIHPNKIPLQLFPNKSQGKATSKEKLMKHISPLPFLSEVLTLFRLG